MFDPIPIPYKDKNDFYNKLETEFSSMLDGDLIADCANLAALLYFHLPRINWAGFYLLKKGELVVGPFQGLPACVRIALGRGVCGTAALRQSSVLVPDVHSFPGHIACDARSRSEIVIPVFSNDSGRKDLIGVLDVDSPEVNRFDFIDQSGLESLVALLKL